MSVRELEAPGITGHSQPHSSINSGFNANSEMRLLNIHLFSLQISSELSVKNLIFITYCEYLRHD